MKRLLLFLFTITLFITGSSYAQSPINSSYKFSVGTTIYGGPINYLPTTLIGPNSDNVSSGVINFPTGFTFSYAGQIYTQFSVTENGLMTLGSTPLTGNETSNAMAASIPGIKIAPYWDDLSTGTNGKVIYEYYGNILYITWFVTVPKNTLGTANTYIQIRLGGSGISYYYGASTTGFTTVPANAGGYSIGIGSSSTDFASVTVTGAKTATVAYGTANDANTLGMTAPLYFSFTPDITAPTISAETIPNTLGTANRTLTKTIADAGSGVPTSGSFVPRIYYKKNAGGTYVSTPGVLASGTSASGTWTFTVDHALLGGVAQGDVIYYYVAAQDLSMAAGQPNISSSPAGVVATDVNTIITPPATPASYIIPSDFTGVKTVGSGGDYASLTNSGGLFQQLSAGTVTGNVTVNIISDLTSETGAVPLTAWAEGPGGPFTVTINPVGARIVSGTSPAVTGLIYLNGAKNLIIDGLNTGGNSLTITNLSPNYTTVNFTGGTSNVAVKNSTLKASSAGGAVVTFGNSITTAGNSNNTVSGCTITSDVSVPYYGIFFNSGATTQSLNNIINNNKIINFTNTAVSINSYYVNTTISNNEIYNAIPSGISLNGIYISNYYGGGAYNIFGNYLHDLNPSSTAGTGTVNGIYYNQGSYMAPYDVLNIYNNVISLDASVNNTALAALNGVWINGGGASTSPLTSANMYYNSIYIGGTGITAGTSNGLKLGGGNYYTKNTVNNNAIFNARSGGTGKNYGISCYYNYGFVSGNNDIYVTGANGIFGLYISADYPSLTSWQTATSQDAYSYSGDPGFTSSTNLLPNPANPNSAILDNHGLPIATISTDILGNPRSTSLPTLTDIGAYENNNTSSTDIFRPSLSFTPITDTGLTTNQTISATITDNVGVSGGANLPRIYYKKASDANVFGGNTSADNGWKYTQATNTTSPYSFIIDYSILFGGTVSPGNAIQYFIVAQDDAGNFVSKFSGTVAGTPNPVQNVTAAPPLISVDTYLILNNNISGSFSVPGDYASLTGKGGLFDVINKGIVTGNINVSITDNLVEPGTVALNQFASPFTLTIAPGSASLKTITGNVNDGLIRLSGADRVTIDGRFAGSGKFLEFSNTSAGTNSTNSAFMFVNAATYNTVQYCTVKAQNSVGAVIYFWGISPYSGANSFNTIDHCDITNSGTGYLQMGIYSYSNVGGSNVSNTISNCNISDFNTASSAYGIYLSYGNSDWTITGNSLYQTASRTLNAATFGIYIVSTGGANYTVSNNYIGGSAPNAGGTPWTYSGGTGGNFYTLNISAGAANPTKGATITNNTITNFDITNNNNFQGFQGIYVSGSSTGPIPVTGNTIGSSSSSDAIVLRGGTSTTYGMNISGTTAPTDVSNNIIGGITTTSGFYGIYASGTTGTQNINGNTIGSSTVANSIKAGSIATSTSVTALYSTSNAINSISNNTIANISNLYQGTSTGNIIGISFGGTGAATVNGNTLFNLVTNSASAATLGSASAIGILKVATTAASSISQNIIHGIENKSATGIVNIAGITVTSASGSLTVARNTIYGLSLSTVEPTASITGIYLGGGTSSVQNSDIRLGTNASGVDITAGYAISGIYNGGGTNSYYFNSLNVSGVGVSGITSPTYALNGAAAVSILQDNVLVNTRSGGTTGLHYALKLASAPTTIDYNNYFVAGGTGFLAAIGATDYTDFATWKSTAVTGKDLASLNVDPAFTSVSNLTPTNAALIAGLTIAGITVDNTGTIRAATPTIGAFEGFSCVNPTSGGTIAADQAGCNPFTPALITSTLAASGQMGTLEYKWQQSTTSNSTGFTDITGATAETYSPVSLTQTTWYKRLARVNCKADWVGAAESNVVTMTVNPIPSVTTANTATICSGSGPAISLTASIASNFTWTVGSVTGGVTGATNSSGTTINQVLTNAGPLTGTVQYLVTPTSVTGSCVGAAHTITVTVNPIKAVSVTIIGVNQVCEGTLVNYAAFPTNGGTSPSFVWKVNGIPQGTTNTFSYTPANGNIITCELTPDNTIVCPSTSVAVSNAITMTVTPLVTPTITIGTLATSVCAGGSLSVSVNTKTNEGVTPTYQWKVNGINSGTNSPAFTYTAANYTVLTTDVITCEMTSSLSCVAVNPAISNSVNITVNPLPVAPTVTLTQPTCATVTGTITVTAPTEPTYTVTGTNPVVAAVSNGTGIFAGLTPGIYDVTATNANGCTSVATSVTINTLPVLVAPTASVTVQPNYIVATGTIVVTTPAEGSGYNYSIDAGTTWVTTATFAGLVPGNYSIIVKEMTTGCISPATALTVSPVPPAPIPTITGPVDPITLLPATLAGGITTGQVYTTQPGMTGYVWTVSPAGTITAPADPTVSNTITVTWTNPTSQQSVSVSYTDPVAGPAATPTVLIINYYPFAAAINPASIPQFVDPLPHFAAGLRINAKAGGSLIVREDLVQQVALSTGTVLATGTIGVTPGAGLGKYAGYAISNDGGTTFAPAMWPARTIEARVGNPLTVQYQNALTGVKYSDFNILADQTLMMNGYTLTGNPLTDPYTGDIPMVVHLHGGEMPSNSDGGPTAWFMPNGNPQVGPGFAFGASSLSTYPNQQEEGTLWYHPHDQGLTRINVYTGLAGYYFLRGPAEEAAQLPGWSGDDKVQEVTPTDIARTTTFNATAYLPEIELAVQDRMFNLNGELYWPVAPTNPDLHPFWTPEFVGDVMTVNGKSWPYLSVAPRKYRFRMLDGCNARFLNVWLMNLATATNGPAISVVGSDGGLLDAPAILAPGTPLLMAPGERYDVVIDFSGVAPGTVFTMMNNAPAPYPTGTPVSPGTTDRIMQFVVNGTMVSATGGAPADKSLVPANLRPANPMVKLTDFAGNLTTGVTPTVKREIILNEVTAAGGPAQVLFNNSHFDAVTPIPGAPPSFGGPTELPVEGTTEQFTIINTTADAHPIHIHLAQWQLVSRQTFNVAGYMAAYATSWATNQGTVPIWPAGLGYPGGAGSPLPYSTVNADGAVGGNPAVTPFLTGTPIPANSEERVWKDDIKAFPGEVATYIVRFAPTAKPIAAPLADLKYPFDPSAGPGYVWHCHIIDHEDMDMMRPLMVQPSPTLLAPQITAQPAPTEVCDGTLASYSVTATSARTISYQWQVSSDAGLTFTNLANVAPYSGVTTKTLSINPAALTLTANQYRVVLTSTDGTTTSNAALLTVDPVSVGGSVTGGATVSAGTNSTLLTLSGNTGNILNWESSPDGITWTPIVNALATYTATNLTTTTQYRAVVQSGVCTPANSASATVTVTAVTPSAPIPTITGPVDPITLLPATLAGGITTGQVYTTQPGMTGYTWTVSPAGTITAGAGTNSITVTWTNPTSQQSVSVSYTDPVAGPAATPTVLIINYYPFTAAINPASIPQFVDPLPHFAAGLRINAKAGGSLIVREDLVQQVALSTGTVLATGTIGVTPGAGLGKYAGYAISNDGGTTFAPAMWPARTIEARVGNPLTVQYQNALTGVKYSDFNILADQTLMMNGYTLTGNPLTDPYTGDIPMVVHLHGGEMPSNSDGGPTAWFMPNGNPQVGPGFAFGASSLSTYPNQQEEGTLWYHPHDQGLTRINVYTGLAGYYFLRGPAEEAAQLPGWSGDDKVQEVTPTDIARTTTFNATAYLPEIELAVQDRMFNLNGELYWPVAPTNPDLHPFWTPEFVGDVMTVNGKSWPYLSVAPRKYRFRMLDGCNARFLNVWLMNLATATNGPAISVVGSDGGLLDAPAILAPGTPLLMAPGERYDVVIDFSGVAPGTVFTMMNNAPAPYPTGTPVSPGTTDRIMQFVVNGTMVSATGGAPADKSLVPANLRPANPMVKLTDFAGNLTTGVTPTVKREIILNEVTAAGGPAQVLFNNSHFDAVTPIPGAPPSFGGPTELPVEGTTEQFTIINTTADAHPIHIHLAQWQLVSRQTFNVAGYMAAYATSWATNQGTVPIWPAGLGYPGGAGSPLPYSTVNADGAVGGNPAVTPFLTGTPIPANSEERVWKDDIKAFPGEVATYIVRFAPTAKPIAAPLADLKYPFDPSAGPGYVWHCHIIDHEDMDMMRPLMVQPSPTLLAPQITAQPAPTEVCDGTLASYSVTATSARTISYQWQVSSDAGLTFTNLANVAPYSGVTTKTLSINPAALTLTANQYRVVLTSTDGTTTSNAALLTVDQAVAAAGPITGSANFTPGATGVPYSITPIANATTYVWSYSGTGVTINTPNPLLGNEVTLDFAAGATVGVLSVKGHSACGDGTVSNLSITTGAKVLDLKVYLEDVYVGPAMSDLLRTSNLIPLTQPYNVAPWNYPGTESVASIPVGVVDWVLVELRDAPTPDAALPATVVPGWPKAYFLKSDGTIVDLDGVSLPNIGNPVITNNLYVIVRHRNHIDIMSATSPTLTTGVYNYDFTTSVTQAYNGTAGYKQIAPGVFGMVAGDADGDGDITTLDFTKWATDFGQSVYIPSDIDLDGSVSVLDFSSWATNFGVANISPLKKATIGESNLKYHTQVPGGK
jgi:FtsP/CotA-like multicopper oxidase with cupredoxin domain